MPATQRPVAVEVAAARWNKVAKRTPPDIISRHKELRSNEAYLPLVGPIIILCRPLWVLMIIHALPFLDMTTKVVWIKLGQGRKCVHT